MLFNSFAFLLFFPVVTLVYLCIPKKTRYIWLLLASYFFYACWSKKCLLLIILSTVITYFSGILIEKAKTVAAKKWVVAGSLVSNLGILFFFKYFMFALHNLNGILGLFNISPVAESFSIILPVGISFYTFQALGYTIDVYRGEIKAERNPIRYALFVSFFPQLVAGPIERSRNLLSQVDNIEKIKVWDYDRIVSGLIMMFFGLFQKMVIADRIAIFANSIFAGATELGTVELIFGAIAFSIQIYCDFAAYSTIAIGAAKVMGFTLMENFNTPYFATGIKDFWARWHISLSTWFRDYLYIPLGGNRHGKIRKYLNIIIVFLASGIWHGASWNFVFWGLLHGIYQVLEDMLKLVLKKINTFLKVDTTNFSYHFGSILITYICVTFSWIFFRADTMEAALAYVGNMFTRLNPWVLFDSSLFNYGLDRPEANILFVALLILIAVDLLKYIKHESFSDFLMKQGVIFRFAVMIILIVSIFVYGEYGVDFDSTKFIYFDF